MKSARRFILPGYLLLCLLIGGSSQAIWGNAALQLMAIGILAWAALARDPQPLTRSGKWLLAFVGALILLILVQVVPLPPGIWTTLPGRRGFVTGFQQLGMELPWMPISQAPYDTLTTAMTLLPPFALLYGLLRLRDWDIGWIFAAIVGGAIASVLLGLLQVTGGDGAWYFYRITNHGVAVGTFANGNHFATLLLAAIPALAAIAASNLRSDNKQQRLLSGALAIGAAAALAIGAATNSSAAFLVLGPPVIIASFLLVSHPRPKRIKQAVLGIVVLLVVAAASMAILGSRFPGWGTTASIETRTTFWTATARAIRAEGLFGSGFGTFEKVYSRHEDPSAVDRFYVNHAHNDYLELVLEGGIPATALLVFFLVWWSGRARAVWFTHVRTVQEKAAVIASAAILLHSIFDYPLRTAAIAAIMGASLAILAGAKGRVATAKTTEPKARHATL